MTPLFRPAVHARLSWISGVALVPAALLATLSVNMTGQSQLTLRQELQRHGLAATGLDDSDQEITSYAVLAEAEWFGIAYYWWAGPGTPLETLRIRTHDRATGAWRTATIPASERAGGSALRMARGAEFIYVALHLTPSAGDLLVLDASLTLRDRVKGWPLLMLPDGRVVYHHNMVHFAPVHAASVSLYDPRTRSVAPLHPPADERKADLVRTPKNRSLDSVQRDGSRGIRLTFTEQDRKWIKGEQRTEAASPERQFTVVCHLDGPRCALESR